MMYFFGKGCECNKNEGMRLLKLSAEMGNPYSCYAFAALFDNGAAGITAEEAEGDVPHCRRSRRGRSGGKAEARVRKPKTD